MWYPLQVRAKPFELRTQLKQAAGVVKLFSGVFIGTNYMQFV